MATEIKGARDALVEIVNKLEPIVTYMKPSEEYGLSTVYAACKPIYDIAQAALALPRRNCDVGTAKEQEDRFKKYCRGSNYCAVCPIRKLWDFRDGHSPSCTILWSQMPYEAEQRGGAE